MINRSSQLVVLLPEVCFEGLGGQRELEKRGVALAEPGGPLCERPAGRQGYPRPRHPQPVQE